MKRLNLGSGARPLEGYVNVDLSPGMPGVGLVHDLDRMPWPFENDSIDEIVMAHCLEHLADCNAAMREIHRILAGNSGNYLRSTFYLATRICGSNPQAFFWAPDLFLLCTTEWQLFRFRFQSL